VLLSKPTFRRAALASAQERNHVYSHAYQHPRVQAPFLHSQSGGLQPAGTYTVETEEELVEGLSFPAYRRVSTTITRQGNSAGALVQVFTVDPQELEKAQAADRM